MSSRNFKIRLLNGFDDPFFGPDKWEKLLMTCRADDIYLTWPFQRAWWETLGHGKLLLLAAEINGEIRTVAPLYTDEGMIFLIGSAFDSDYLGLIGDISELKIIEALLDTAQLSIPKFLGFKFYFIPDSTGLGQQLKEAAKHLNLVCYEEDDMPAPTIDLAEQADLALKFANRKSFLKLERFYSREGSFNIIQLTDGKAILLLLDEFFEQHIERWAETSTPSRFLNENARRLIIRFTELAAETGWLRFTRIEWKGHPLAFHYGYCYRGRYFWGMPSFDKEMAHKSPGKLMIRHLILSAVNERARLFDLGTGAQPFKVELSTQINRVRTYGLYPDKAPQSKRNNGELK